MRRKLSKSQRGFTLVELALSAALIGIISGSLALIFKSSLDLVDSSEDRNEVLQAARNGMSRMMAELRHCSEIYQIEPDYLRFKATYLAGGSTETKTIAYSYSGDTISRWVISSDWQPFIENVTYFRVGGITLWATLDNESSINYPKLRPGGVSNGPHQFLAMKFGSGFYPDKDSVISSVNFPASGVVDAGCGAIEFWYRPYYSVDDPNASNDKVLVKVSTPMGRFLVLYYDTDLEKLIFEIDAGTTKQVLWRPDWEVGSLLHIAVVWDSEGEDIGDGQTMALFADGIQRNDSGQQTNQWDAVGVSVSDLMIGDWTMDGTRALAMFDNLKVYNYPKTNFDDRNREDAVGAVTVDIRLDNGSGEITMRDAANVN